MNIQDEPNYEGNDNYDPNWFDALVEPDEDTIQISNKAGEEMEIQSDSDLLQEMANYLRGVIPSDLLNDPFGDAPQQPPVVTEPLSPMIVRNPTPEHVFDNTLQRIALLNEASEIEQRILDQTKEIADLKEEVKALEAAAINNWDSAAKAPKDPNQPYNDGSNEDKRKAWGKIQFSNHYYCITQAEQILESMRQDLKKVNQSLAILAEIRGYYEWWLKYSRP